MTETNSKSSYQTSETSSTYVNPDQMSDLNNIRLRHIKVDISILIKNMFVFLCYHSQIFQ